MVNIFEYFLESFRPDSIGQWIKEGYFSGKPKWRGETIPDLTGKVAIVTGGSSGIGKDVVQILLEHNAKVYLAARGREKSEEVIKQLADITGKSAIFLKLDLADLPSVKAAATEFNSKETDLHYLFNNGGVGFPGVEEVTAQGYDLQFGTNVLGHFYFAKLLMPTLTSTASRSTTNEKGRIVTTSSSATLFRHTFRFDWLKDGPERLKAHPGLLYTQSKVGDALLAMETAKRYGEFDIVANYCNPGNLKTDFNRHATGLLKLILSIVCIWPAKWGAYTLLWAAFGPGSENTNGKYIAPWGRVGKPGPFVNDAEVEPKLWEWLEEQVKDI